VSPHGGILAQRLTTLARLSRLQGSDKPLIVLTTGQRGFCSGCRPAK